MVFFLKFTRIPVIASIFTLILACISATVRAEELSEILGVTHSNGKYYLTQKDYLNEGADQILAMGSKVIKLYLTNQSPEKYPWNSNWPMDFRTLAQLAQTPYFKAVFAKPFRTFVLTTYRIGEPNHHYWTAGIS